jgi:putative transposase
MKRKRWKPEEIIPVLKEVEAGESISAVCRRHGVSEPTFYRWREKYAGMEAEEAVRLKTLEDENSRLKRLLADAMLDLSIAKEAIVLLGKR